MPAEQVHDGIAAQHPVGMLDKDMQQIELGPGQFELFESLQQHPLINVQLVWPKLSQAGFMTRLRLWLWLWLWRATAQHRPHPSKKLTRIEGFWHVIIGAHFKTDDAINLLSARRNHDDRQFVVATQTTRQRESVLAGQHEIKYHEISGIPGKPGIHIGAILHRIDVKPLFAKIHRQKVAGFPVVIDD